MIVRRSQQRIITNVVDNIYFIQTNYNLKQISNQQTQAHIHMQETVQSQRFQKQLKSKLQFKASSKVSPDTYLYKSFKFFDLFNNGYVDKSNFFKTMAKCGVVVDTHDAQTVYGYYANREDGNVDYKLFIEELLFKDEEQGQERQYSEMGQSQYSNRQQQLPQQQLQQQSPLSPMQRSNVFLNQSRRSQQPLHQSMMKQSRIDKLYTQCETYNEVVDYIKKIQREKGISALLNFAIQLKSTDTTRTHKINKHKLRSKLSYLSDKAIDLIMTEFTTSPHGEINYAELIYSLKGQLQPQHELVIERAFNLLDNHHEKQILIDKVVSQFKNHQYKEQFVKAIKFYQNFQGIDDGVFTDQDFVDFFGFLASAFSDSQQFANFVEKAYFFDDDTRSQRSQGSTRSRQFKPEISSKHNIQDSMKDIMQPDFRKNKQQARQVFQKQKRQQTANRQQILDDKKSVSRHSQSQADKKSTTTSFYIKQVEMIVLRIKKRLASRGTRGFLVFQKSMKNVDTDQDGLITLDQFKQVIKDLKIDITNSQTNLVFDVFDPDSTNLISYDELIHTFKGIIPEKRNELFYRVWGTVNLSEELTTFSQIKHVLNFRGHPDIQTGRKYDDQIWKQIQQTILLIQELNGTPRSQNITKKQFHEYFQNLSLTTSEDLLFQSLLLNFWKMQPKVNINEMYAGSRKLFDPTSKGYLMDHHRYAVKGGSISSNAPFGTSSQPTNYFTENSKL